MCVTANPADIERTRTYVYATNLGAGPLHVCGYQNQARTIEGGNCMFLNFAGTNLQLVRGPERTRFFMDDLTAGLPQLVQYKGGSDDSSRGGSRSPYVETYGDYDVILAQGPSDILSALGQVLPARRPVLNGRLRQMIDFYMAWYGQDSFVLACFNGSVRPRHPITVCYTPRDAQVLTLPGLDGHDGNVPTVGAPVYRDFRCAFAVDGVRLPRPVNYTERWISEQLWAPDSVVGFVDNRFNGPNGDYVVPTDAVRRGLDGRALADTLL